MRFTFNVPPDMSIAFARAARRGDGAAQSMIVRLAQSSSAAAVLRRLPVAVALMTPQERARFVVLRASVVRSRAGLFEHALRRFGRWRDSVRARRRQSRDGT
jgi:hypothetical protein